MRYPFVGCGIVRKVRATQLQAHGNSKAVFSFKLEEDFINRLSKKLVRQFKLPDVKFNIFSIPDFILYGLRFEKTQAGLVRADVKKRKVFLSTSISQQTTQGNCKTTAINAGKGVDWFIEFTGFIKLGRRIHPGPDPGSQALAMQQESRSSGGRYRTDR